MVAEEKHQYRGVLCRHCRQAIPLSPSAARMEETFKEQEVGDLDEFAPRSFMLRCRACLREAHYMVLDVIDCDGTPRMRESQPRKSPPKS